MQGIGMLVEYFIIIIIIIVIVIVIVIIIIIGPLSSQLFPSMSVKLILCLVLW